MDINSLITQLMTVERAPIDNLAKRAQRYQSELSAYGSVKSTLSSLKSAASALAAQAASRPATGTSSDTTVASISAEPGAAKSSYSLEVRTLAQAHKLYGASHALSTSEIGSGTLTIEFGSFTNNTFSVGDAQKTLSISIAPGKSTLADVRDAINAAAGDVSAALVNDGSGKRLVLTSSSTGAAQSMRISVADDDGNNTDGSGLSALAYDPAADAGDGRNLQVAQAAQDAEFTLDGLPMTRASNTVTDAIDNVTIGLSKPGSSSLVVAPDNAAQRAAVDNLVKAYNSAVATMKGLTSYDATTKTGSILLGESTVRGLQTQIRSVINGVYGNAGDTRRSLSAIGLSIQPDGSLAVDSTRYSSALSAAPAEVERVMTAAAKAMSTALGTALAEDETGVINARTSGLQATIKQLAEQQTRMEDRMAAIEARYRAQFTALDNLVSSTTATTTYLTNQFKSFQSMNGN
jgi:flagellar hook-associated protein 2